MKFLLDTDHISILQRQAGPEFAALSTQISRHQPSDLAFCIISLQEQVLGCHTYVNRAPSTVEIVRGYAMLARVLDAFAVARVLPFDTGAGNVYDVLLAQRVRLATMDLRIASIALARGLILLTRNVRDFGKVPGLHTENWTV